MAVCSRHILNNPAWGEKPLEASVYLTGRPSRTIVYRPRFRVGSVTVLAPVWKTDQQRATGNIDTAPEEIDHWRRILTERGAISPAGNGNDQMGDTIREKHSGEEIAEKRHDFHKRSSFPV